MGASSTEFDAEYGADQIQILEGLEAVRKRPGALLFGIKVTGNCSAFKIIHFRGCVFAHFHLISARSEIRTASF